MTALLQMSCVAIEGRALLIAGPPGSGKSSLALALIDRGAVLVGDDGVNLEPRGDRLYAHPPPRFAGKLEVRNLGLLDFPTVGDVPVALVVRLERDAERWIERAESIGIEGLVVPLIRLFPDTPALPLRAEWALRRFGTPV